MTKVKINTTEGEIIVRLYDETPKHRDNFMVNLLGGLAAYCLFPKKPTIRVQTVDCYNDRQLTIF